MGQSCSCDRSTSIVELSPSQRMPADLEETSDNSVQNTKNTKSPKIGGQKFLSHTVAYDPRDAKRRLSAIMEGTTTTAMLIDDNGGMRSSVSDEFKPFKPRYCDESDTKYALDYTNLYNKLGHETIGNIVSRLFDYVYQNEDIFECKFPHQNPDDMNQGEGSVNKDDAKRYMKRKFEALIEERFGGPSGDSTVSMLCHFPALKSRHSAVTITQKDSQIFLRMITRAIKKSDVSEAEADLLDEYFRDVCERLINTKREASTSPGGSDNLMPGSSTTSFANLQLD